MINKEWPLCGQRQCRTNSTKLGKNGQRKENPERYGYHTDTVMCRGNLECQEKVCKQVIKNILKNVKECRDVIVEKVYKQGRDGSHTSCFDLIAPYIVVAYLEG